MEGFLIAYGVIAGVVAKNLASWAERNHLVDSWFGAFKAVFLTAFVLLWLGDATLW